MNEPWKNTRHPMDGKIRKVLEKLDGPATTVGDIARKINAPCSNVEWHLRQCITGFVHFWASCIDSISLSFR